MKIWFISGGLVICSWLWRIVRLRNHKPEISDYNPELTRDDLIRKCRILVIDDQRPALIDDLTKSGFAVEYDAVGDDMTNVEKRLYDLIILDFAEVGKNYGKDHGLSLLKHIKRVNLGLH